VFPTVKELMISNPRMADEQECMDAIVELAKSQHELEKPFKRVTVRASGIPATMTERLRQWVGAADRYGM
jgi:hypothetical protein